MAHMLKILHHHNSTNFFVISFLLLLLQISEDGKANGCPRSPRITGYSRPHGELLSEYHIRWQSPTCPNSYIIQYQIQFIGNCSAAQPETVFSGNNRTSSSVVIPQCVDAGCYVRLRAELSDGTFSAYSSCVLIDNQLPENRLYIELYQTVCSPIQGACGPGFAPEFYINGHLTLWPGSGTGQYNVTYYEASRTFNFCFSNITEAIILTEYCYRQHIHGCVLCSTESGEINFLSYSEIRIINPKNKFAMSPVSSVVPTTNIDYTSALTSTIQVTKTVSAINSHSTAYFTNSDQELPPMYGSFSVSTTLGIAGGGVLSLLIGMGLLATAIILWCQKRDPDSDTLCFFKRKSAAGNIYDEPSLPEPIYQELCSNVNSEMTGNESYGVALKETFELQDCLAYASRNAY